MTTARSELAASHDAALTTGGWCHLAGKYAWSEMPDRSVSETKH